MAGMSSLTGGGGLDLGAGPSTSGDSQSGAGFSFGGIDNSKPQNNLPIILIAAVAVIYLWRK